jgi:hypothetical protein
MDEKTSFSVLICDLQFFMRKRDRDLVLDFLTLAIAVFCLSFLVSAFASMLKPCCEVFDRVFKELFSYSIFSIGIFYSLFHIIKYLLSFKFSMPEWLSGALWIPTIILATFLFTYFAFDSGLFGYFEPFMGFLSVALIPAAMFRLTVIFAVSFWEERKRKGTLLSITK